MRVLIIACFVCLTTIATGYCQQGFELKFNAAANLEVGASLGARACNSKRIKFPPAVNPMPHLAHNFAGKDGLLHGDEVCTLEFLKSAGRPSAIFVRTGIVPEVKGSRETNSLNALFSKALNKVYPDHPSIDRQKLRKVLDQIRDSKNMSLDYVFTDVEVGNRETDRIGNALILELVNRYRTSALGPVKVGAYPHYPGARDLSGNFPGYIDRTIDSDFYETSGLTVAMPTCYPYSYFKSHKKHYPIGQKSPNERCALFWAPIHRCTLAYENLPDGHELIPWLSGFVPFLGYEVAPPTKADLLASVQHFRMRGADGYIVLHLIGPAAESGWFKDGEYWIRDYNNNKILGHDDNVSYATDVEQQWSELDGMFGDQPTTRFFSRASEDDEFSEKRSGILFSGLRYGNNIRILVSNLGNVDQAIVYPDLYDLPHSSPEIPAPAPTDPTVDAVDARANSSDQHQTFFYKIVNLLDNGNFNSGSDGWYLRNGTRHLSTAGIGSSGALSLDVGMSCFLDRSKAKPVDSEPNANMVMTVRAKGENAILDAVFSYRHKESGDILPIPVTWENGPNQPVDSSFQTYVARFTTPGSIDGHIWPVLYNSKQNDNVENELIVDDIVVKFDDGNLLLNGGFDYKTPAWNLVGHSKVLSRSGIAGTPAVQLGPVFALFGTTENTIPVSPGQSYKFSVQAKSSDNAMFGFQYSYYDQNRDQIHFVPVVETNVRSNRNSNQLGFVHIRKKFRIPEGAHFIRPIFYNRSGGDLIVDDVSITKTSFNTNKRRLK